MAASVLLDTSVKVNYGPAAPAASFNMTLNTGGINGLAKIAITTASTTQPSISGGSGLTWTIQKSQTVSNPYVWVFTAPLASQQSSVTLTVTIGSSAYYAAILDTYLISGRSSIPAIDATVINTGLSGTSISSSISVGQPNATLDASVVFSAGGGTGGTTITSGTNFSLNDYFSNGTTGYGIATEVGTVTVNQGSNSASFNSTVSSSGGTMVIISLYNNGVNTVLEHYQFFNDDGTTINNSTDLSGQTLTATQDGAFYDIETATKFHIRTSVANTASQAGSISRRLEFSESGGSWTQITTGTNNVRLASSTGFSDGDATTSRLTNVGTFMAGQGKQSGSDTSSVSLTNGYCIEDEWCVVFQAGAAGKSYQFRVTNAGTPLNQYPVLPTISPLAWSTFGGFVTASYSWQNRKSHVNIRSSSASYPAYFRLVDGTSSNTVVANSKVGTTNTTITEVTGSSSFPLTSGHQYYGQIGVAHGATVSLVRVSNTP